MPIKIGICGNIVAGFRHTDKWRDVIGAVGLREACGSSGERETVMRVLRIGRCFNV